jgi:acyl-CoA thioester hydrolase
MHFQFDMQIRVRYAEADRMGYVYYGNYATYFESARTEWLRKIGFAYREWEDKGILLPVRELKVHYHAPAYYDDLLTIRTIIKEKPLVRITFHHEVFNQEGEKTCTGSVMLVFVNSKTRKPMRAPDFFLKALEEYRDNPTEII